MEREGLVEPARPDRRASQELLARQELTDSPDSMAALALLAQQDRPGCRDRPEGREGLELLVEPAELVRPAALEEQEQQGRLV